MIRDWIGSRDLLLLGLRVNSNNRRSPAASDFSKVEIKQPPSAPTSTLREGGGPGKHPVGSRKRLILVAAVRAAPLDDRSRRRSRTISNHGRSNLINKHDHADHTRRTNFARDGVTIVAQDNG